ncbi:lysylphosphatidylglycerol synthase transmembrane domain-containing protein [Salipaludibacillus agaradhaerens]|uniref:lysylphosphatidylglycerol synthase transmembrane domain-containing protein n=1 Tax=Salipaludibacillus agaradhaerens TaxID=76935 RepID=UPI0009971515|nr:lysylphosphatidylglycerol synthase transmembrane domain-containing protein [Salipaludibacillus agaradhaerens]
MKKRLFNIILIFTISIGFIAYHFRTVDTASVWEGLKNAHIGWLFGGMFAMFLYWLLEAFILHRISRKVTIHSTIGEAFRITLVGQFFNTITPLATGGQPAQLYILTKNGMDAGAASSVLLIKLIVYQGMLVVNSLIVLLFGYHYLLNGSLPKMSVLILMGFTLNTLFIVALIVVGKNKKIASLIVHFLLKPVSFFTKTETYSSLKNNVEQKMNLFHAESKRISVDLKLLLQCSVLTTLQLWLFFSIPYFVLQGVGAGPLDLLQIIAFHTFIIMFSSLIPIPGGSGGAELSFSLLFGLILDPTTLVLSLFLWRFITYYSCILFGSISLMVKKKEKAQDFGKTTRGVEMNPHR